MKRSQFWQWFFSFLFVLKNWSLLCPTIDLIWLKTFRSLLFYFMIIIISVLEMVDLYRKDRSNFASRKVDLGLGETIKLYCIQAHKVIEQDNRLYLFISTTRQAAALKIREIITCLSRSTSLIIRQVSKSFRTFVRRMSRWKLEESKDDFMVNWSVLRTWYCRFRSRSGKQ